VNAPDTALDWTTLNQRLLVAELARLKARLEGGDEAAAMIEVEAARAALPEAGAIDTLAEAFGLTVFEREIVLLCAGVEMDSRLGALCAEAGGAPRRPWPSFGLALAALAEPHWSALAPVRPLRRWRLVEIDEAEPLASARLRLDERVLHFLAGVELVDARLEPLLRPVEPASCVAAGHVALAGQLASELVALRGRLPLVQLVGDDLPGREDVAARCAALLGLRLQLLDAAALPLAAADIAALATLWEREALLGASALLLTGGEVCVPALTAFAERVGGLVFVGLDAPLRLRRQALRRDVERPTPAEQQQLWRQALGEHADMLEEEIGAVAMQFRLSARDIAEAAAGLDAASPAAAGALWRACRGIAPARLAALAQRIDAQAGWDDLVLAEAQKHALAQIAVHMRRRFEVHEAWGFAAQGARGLGITALFAGESGTGKTLAAEVLARTLRLELYRIDLSAVVSKYIGETEKNLRRVFNVAEDSGAVLLFDEADALFGKRSEVKDSHDRYANIEVSYLLQRMEGYRGLAILTTNHKAALDGAFMRRLRFVVQFPFPEAAEREAIWRRAFPPAAPTRDLAWARLARLQVAGGHIRNIALGAAFCAAEAGEPVGMAHVLRAAQLDAAKRERALSESETRGWV
jgi:hypothetical protein